MLDTLPGHCTASYCTSLPIFHQDVVLMKYFSYYYVLSDVCGVCR